MARWPSAALLVLALTAALGAGSSPLEQASRRRLASANDTPSVECPRAALYIIPALPNVKDAPYFELVRATYISTVKSLAPAGTISEVIPTLVEPNKVKGGVSVHTTILFSGSCEAGKAAARTLHVKLLGDVRPLFYVPAPRAKSLFGDVYMITVSHPYLADGTGAKLVAPVAPAGTNLAAQFSITWEDIAPSKIGELQAAAFKAAILKQLPAGAGVYFTTMITEGVSYRLGNHWRACAAPVSPTVAKSAGKTSQGGEVWPPGQPADVKSGRLVFNTNVHGTVFNTAAGKVILTKFMDQLRSNTAAVFPPHTFGRMQLEPGYGLRLVNDPAYPCTCEVVPPPTLTLAQAYGPTSATATAAGAANVAWVRWEFTATPASGTAVTVGSDTPLVWWYNLAANTQYTISVVGITRSGKRTAGANTLSMTTPRQGAPTVAAASPTSSTQATVRLSPPTNGATVSEYIASVCLKSQPTNCKRLSSPFIEFMYTALVPGAQYVVSATAKIGSTVVPASNSLPLVMPQRGAPILLTAAATSAITGSASAAPPNGASFGKYVFKALSPSGLNASSTVTNPLLGRFTGLRPATQYDVTVVGYTGATPSVPSNTLSFVTPAANAPLNTGTPKSPYTVVIKLVPPTIPPANGGSWVRYDVTLCPVAGPLSACVSQRTGGSGRRLLATPADIAIFEGRTPFTTYNFVSNAISESGEISKQAMTSQVTTPGAFPWSVEVNADSITQTSATVKITPPSEGGPFVKYVLAVCPKPQSGAPNWDACPQTNCLPNQVAACPISGLAAGTAYLVSGVAFTTADVATIRSAADAFATLLWPGPELGAVTPGTVDLSTATVPVTAAELLPPGGWSLFNISVCAISGGACTYQTCTPVRAAPTPTTCTLTGLSQGTTYKVQAVAQQGSLTSALSNLRFVKTNVQDAPNLVGVQAQSFVSGLACVKPPTLGGPWTGGFQCKSCFGGKCVIAPKCTLDPKRRLLASSCVDSVACNLGKLESSTNYDVSCVALTATDAPSPVSNTLVLSIEPAPGPELGAVTPGTVDLSTATVPITAAELLPPGGWSLFNISVCATSGGACTYQTCTPVRAAPTPTTCTLTGLSQGTTYKVQAVAQQGSLTSALSNLRFVKTNVQDGPNLVGVKAQSFDSGLACVKPPTFGGPWVAFQCKSCFGGKCVDAPKCSVNPTRRLLAPSCVDSVPCQLGRLESSTNYNVSCVAVTATDAPSPVSNTLVLPTEPAPAPPVETDQANPVILLCSAPGGGPWATCAISLCEQQGPNRRRLQESSQCTPIDLTCPFVSGVARCDVTGKVKQYTTYDITSTAIKADGVRKSTTGPQGTYFLPVFPAPTITAANAGGNKYNVTIVPVTTTPLKSYPKGGWTWYSITTLAGNPPVNQEFSCGAKNSAGGVPQTVTCQVTLASSNLPASFIARAFQGTVNAPVDTTLRSATTIPYTPTTVFSAQSMSITMGSLCVAPPSAGGPWTSVNCTACYKGSCLAPQACSQPARRRQLLAPNPCDAFANTKMCWLRDLESTTTYDVTCQALTASNVASAASNQKSLTTNQAPAPQVSAAKYNPVILECTPPDGGPWKTCELSLCEQPGPTRRRLLEPSGCTPINLSCPFVNDVAKCDVTGKVQQGIIYDVTSTATKADGTRKSKTEARGTYTLAFYPAPTITLAVNAGGNKWNVTIEPVDSVPLVSFPLGAWVYYTIQASGGLSNQAFTCMAKTTAGVPQPVTCQVDVAFNDLPVSFDAQAFQGTVNAPVDTTLRSATSIPYTPVTIFKGQGTSYDQGAVCVKPPSAGGPFTKFNCTACYNGQCLPEQTCGDRRRRLLGGAGPCDAILGSTACYLNNIEASSVYDVTCKAVTDASVAVGPSNAKSFTTFQAGTPTVTYDSSNPPLIQCDSPGGGPWATCESNLCKVVIGRRRLQSGCSPITIQCNYNQVTTKADCDTAGAVEMDAQYEVNATAIKADGVRKSTTGQGNVCPYILPYYPKVTLSNLVTLSSTSFNVTITPDVFTPLVSFPSGGWTKYEISPQVGGLGQGVTDCTAVNTGGIPQAVVCTFSVITAPSNNLRVQAQAVKSMSPKPYPLETTMSDWLNQDA